MREKTFFAKLLLVIIFMMVGLAFYLFYGTAGNFLIAFYFRGIRLPSFLIVGVSTTIATIVFQTITQNSILTPNIIGLDALFNFFQTLIVFIFGSASILVMNSQINFLLSLCLLMLASILLYSVFLKDFSKDLFLLLMTGLVFGILMNSLTTFLQVMIDPNEFNSVLSQTLASFYQVDSQLIILACMIVIPVFVFLFTRSNYLDIYHLGEKQATTLGINVNREYLIYFMLISLLTAVSTSLIGPSTFLGFIGANLSYRVFNTYQHKKLFVGGSFLTTTLIIYGQFLVEHFFNNQTTIGVVLEFVGGIYFLYILLRERKNSS